MTAMRDESQISMSEIRQDVKDLRLDVSTRFRDVDMQLQGVRDQFAFTSGKSPRMKIPKWVTYAGALLIVGVVFRWVSIELDFVALNRVADVAAKVIR